MGYYTKYELSIHDDQGRYLDMGDIVDALVKHVDYDPLDESCKWYDHEDDMKWLSKEYSGTVFKLHGEGEESGDLWDKYFLNGKMQACKAIVTYDEYSVKKLK